MGKKGKKNIWSSLCESTDDDDDDALLNAAMEQVKVEKIKMGADAEAGPVQEERPVAHGARVLGKHRLRKMMSMRIGPPPGGRMKGVTKEQLMKEYEEELNKIIGVVDHAGNGVMRVDQVIFETPGDPMTNVTVKFSCPLHYIYTMQSFGAQ